MKNSTCIAALALALLATISSPVLAKQNAREKCEAKGGTWREVDGGSGDYACYSKAKEAPDGNKGRPAPATNGEPTKTKQK